MKNDYPELEGKEVEVQTMFSYNGEVIGCNRHIGITVVGDDGEELMCINGPSSPHYDRMCNSFESYDRNYNRVFDSAVAMIEEGVITQERIHEALGDDPQSHGFGNAPRCPYK